jgi:hypothetical protein
MAHPSWMAFSKAVVCDTVRKVHTGKKIDIQVGFISFYPLWRWRIYSTGEIYRARRP